MPILKPGHTDMSIPQNLWPISLLSCLGRTFEKILTGRQREAGHLTGGINTEQMGCLHDRSAIDALMLNLTEPHAWLRQKYAYKHQPLRPSIMANEIDGACNCVVHSTLREIMSHYRFPSCPIDCISDFNNDQQIHMRFDRESEEPVPFHSGLSQGSLISPILFVNYAGALSTEGNRNPTQWSNSYVNDKAMVEGANSLIAARQTLQERLDKRIQRASHLNIKFAPAKAELKHLIPFTSGKTARTPTKQGSRCTTSTLLPRSRSSHYASASTTT